MYTQKQLHKREFECRFTGHQKIDFGDKIEVDLSDSDDQVVRVTPKDGDKFQLTLDELGGKYFIEEVLEDTHNWKEIFQ